MQPNPSKHSPSSTSIEVPSEFDKIAPERQISSLEESNSTVTKTPFAGDSVAPVREKPNTVVADVEIVKPFAVAEPPEAPVTVTPVKSNWNPPTSSSLFMTISNVPPEELTFDNERL